MTRSEPKIIGRLGLTEDERDRILEAIDEGIEGFRLAIRRGGLGDPLSKKVKGDLSNLRSARRKFIAVFFKGSAL